MYCNYYPHLHTSINIFASPSTLCSPFTSPPRHHPIRRTRNPTNRRLHARRDITPIMRHMRPHQMPRTQRAIQTQFTGQHTRRNDARELARVVAGGCGVCAADAEKVEHGGLGLEDGAAADGADFD